MTNRSSKFFEAGSSTQSIVCTVKQNAKYKQTEECYTKVNSTITKCKQEVIVQRRHRGRWWVAQRKRLRLGMEMHTSFRAKRHEQVSYTTHSVAGMRSIQKAAVAGLHAGGQDLGIM